MLESNLSIVQTSILIACDLRTNTVRLHLARDRARR